MTETLYDGKIVKVKKLGHEPKHKRPNEGKPYTLFDIVIEGEKNRRNLKCICIQIRLLIGR